MVDLEQQLASNSVNILILATVMLLVLAAICLKLKKPSNDTKKAYFIAICAAVIIPTLYLAGSTIYINAISSSKGPVHWHSDIEIWSCGQELNLKDPKGLSNKIGTATLHEHNDKRIHLEGVVVHTEDASLGKFFRVIGGELTPTSMRIPTNAGIVSLQNGQLCPTGEQAELQVFVYQTTKDNYYKQQKIAEPNLYLMSPYSNVPAGDCVIVEFGPTKLRTEKLCRSYQVAEKIGKLKGEQNGY